MISDKQIKTFQKLYKDHFGKEIDREEACEKGIKLIQLMDLIYRPITKKQYEKYKK